MRLRLVIQRHSLPDTPIIWDIDTQVGAPTISTLLEQVNEIIPIESRDWGLEDYAVEIKGSKSGLNYECLHFQPVEKVLHEDDEVIIRPLLTPDLRVRKISGRHQISTDGRHLVDGVAFGRPLLRKPVGRPQIDIPPRKKRRVTYDEDEDGTEPPLELEVNAQSTESKSKELVLHAHFDDEDVDEEDDDDGDFDPGEENSDSSEEVQSGSGQLVVHADFDDEDFEPGGEDSDAEFDEQENSELAEEKEPENNNENMEEEDEWPQDEESGEDDVPYDLEDVTDEAVRAQILILHSVFPEISLRVCKLVFEGNAHNLDPTFQDLSRKYKATKSLKSIRKSFTRIGSSASRLEPQENSEKRGKSSKYGFERKIESDTDEDMNHALSGLTFFIAGELPTMSKDEAVAFVQKHGGEMVNSMNAMPSFVLLGSNVKASTIKKMQKLKLEIRNEDGLLNLPRKRAALAEKAVQSDTDIEISDPEEAVEEHDKALLDYYDQNGLPEGCIASGTALEHMATAANIASPQKLYQETTESTSVTSNKGVRFTFDEISQLGNAKSLSDAGKESGDDDSSDTTSEEDESENTSSGSDEDEATSEEDSDDKSSSSSSDSESDSDSDSDSSSDSGAEPEEVTSKPTNSSTLRELSNGVAVEKRPQPQMPSGQGRKSTKARNQRRKAANVLHRFKAKGIIPAETTIKEFNRLAGVTAETSPEDALAALEVVRASMRSEELSEISSKTAAQSAEFEARRQLLLTSLANGGIEVGGESTFKARASPTIRITDSIALPETGPIILTRTVDSADTQGTPKDSNVPSSLPVTTSAPQPTLPQAEASEVIDNITSTSFDNATPKSESSLPTPLPTSSESQDNTGSRRRAKLDLGAGRRLLFGALGLKTPKTKKDEEKVRSDLMKYVRPEKPKEKTPDPIVSADEDEDPEAWRSKINYRAVECCHEGIELSEPPFPFVQRWDPQQKGFWSQRNNRNGKRKSLDGDQYYDDGKPGSKKRKRKNKANKVYETQDSVSVSNDPTPFEQHDTYLDASYVPSHEEESMDAQYEDLSQQTGPFSEDIDGQINDQLMQDVSSIPLDTSQGGEDDLPALPDNVLSLADLKPSDPKVGMVIAFKQLIMSEATKWQPVMSEYRTAVIIQRFENGDLELTLAKRDRLNTEKQYDEDTGERIYGKFAMPDDDEQEDEEDDGNLTVSFSELAEPKIVQPPPASLTFEEDAASPTNESSINGNEEYGEDEERSSHVPETQIEASVEESVFQQELESQAQGSQHPDLPQVEGDVTPETPSHGKATGIDIPKQPMAMQVSSPASRYEDTPGIPPVVPDIPAEPPSEDTKRHITNMIKEAGFRSSVPSSVLRDIRPNGMQSSDDAAVFEKLMKDMTEIEKGSSYSPRFNGLGSSSPADIEAKDSSPVRGAKRRDARTKSAPPMEEPPSNLNTSFGPMTSLDVIDEAEPSTDAHYPNLSAPPSITSQASDHGRQPDFSLPADDIGMQMDDSDYSVLKKYDDAASMDNEPELPPQKSTLNGTERSVINQPTSVAKDTELILSDDSLPSLEQVFSQRASVKRETQTPGLSQVPAKINEDYDSAMKDLSDAEDSDQSTPKASQVAKKTPGIGKLKQEWEAFHPKKTKLAGALRDDQPLRTTSYSQSQPVPQAPIVKTRVPSSQPVVKQSQSQKMIIPEGSQVWDLTLSSDVEVESADEKSSDLDSEDAYFKKFKKYDSDDDDEYQVDEPTSKGQGGWAKKANEGRITRRQASENAQSSQQAKNSRGKTADSRF